MPAMPCDDIVMRDKDGNLYGCPVSSSGLTKREHFAAMAMQGLLSSFGNHDVTDYSEIASDAAMAADALLAALETKGD